MHPLDNPAWSALTGPQGTFAEVDGTVARFPPQVSPFGAFADDPRPEDWQAMAALIGPGAVVITTARTGTPPEPWTVEYDGGAVQMTGEDADLGDPTADGDVVPVPLGAEDVDEMLDLVARTLAAEGADLRDVRLPGLHDFAAVNRVILSSEAWAVHAPWLRDRPADYGRLARRRLMAGAFYQAGDYVAAQRRRRQMITQVEAVLREVDVLLCASSMEPACRIADPEAIARSYPRQARTPFNVTGHPALAMMAGVSSNGLPNSVQFAGRYFDEATVLRVARAWVR